jgi:antitoxin (DNA-binding transcriptional repressor) of toxin-antitoxin stability system
MTKANVHEIKAKLSEYLDRAAHGERIVICRHNTPVAELRALDDVRTEPRPVGPLKGRPTFEIPASFFEPMSDDELKLWEGVAPTDPLSPDWTAEPVRAGVKAAESKTEYGARRPGRAARRRS